LARRRAAMRTLHGARRAELVEEHELVHPHVGEPGEPGVARCLHVRAVLLGGVGGLFFRGSFSRASVRLTVAGCAGLPIASATSTSVASGLRSINARIARSSASS